MQTTINKLLTFVFLFLSFSSFSQRTAIKDSIKPGKRIEIIGAERYNLQDKGDSIGKVFSLAGKAKVQQEKTFFDADSIVLHQKENWLEAFGNVHINDADSVHTYADYVKYLGKERKAFLKNNVKLSDGKGVLTTNDLDYDVAIKMGTYKNGGKIVNGKTKITSKQGYYYGDTRDVYFYKDVAMVSPDTRVFSDTLLYNLNTEIMTFVAPTSIYQDPRKIVTSEGFYNTKNKTAQFGKNSFIDDSTYTLRANQMAIEDSSGKAEFKGDVVYKTKDKKNGYDLLANSLQINKKTKTLLATEKPVLFIKQDLDTIYVSADTIFSAKFNDVNKAKTLLLYTDTINKKLHQFNFDKDSSSNRYFEAYHNVKIFHDSLQAIADSMYYSSLDSVMRLFQTPIVWAKDNQITGDTMLLFIKNKAPEKLMVFENAMAISLVNATFYNQLKGNSITGYFKDEKISLLKTKGSPAQNVYYAQDESNKLVGVNQSFADQINIEFINNKPEKVIFINNLQGTMFPVNQVNHKELQVKNFKWLIDLRPKTKFAVIGE
ncbi:MAG: LPS export ABC transporter periplasmic protein LptC [Bacteroidetes bacterium]|nr:LPS export ABC transporter periplasmic protein LptC [Bacteroidota bacterium]